MDVLQQSEEGFDAVPYRRDSVFSNKWFFGPVFLVAEGAVFKDDLHNSFFGQVMNDSHLSGGMVGGTE